MTNMTESQPLQKANMFKQYAERDIRYTDLMVASRCDRNSHAIASILSNWSVGQSALPARLGLSPKSYRLMFRNFFPGVNWAEDVPKHGELDLDRLVEKDDLVDLLIKHRRGGDVAEEWLAEIIAVACIGKDHLWQDLGLWSRRDLSELLRSNFPTLAARNDKDMKWKKFLYKQLCEEEGVYVCRAPSCDVCSDYEACFGPEE